MQFYQFLMTDSEYPKLLPPVMKDLKETTSLASYFPSYLWLKDCETISSNVSLYINQKIKS